MVTDSLSSTTSLPGVFITGGSDGEIHIWEDKTQEERNKEIERKEEEYQKQQELRICMYKKQWKRVCLPSRVHYSLLGDSVML